jgi:hypothetical protein
MQFYRLSNRQKDIKVTFEERVEKTWRRRLNCGFCYVVHEPSNFHVSKRRDQTMPLRRKGKFRYVIYLTHKMFSCSSKPVIYLFTYGQALIQSNVREWHSLYVTTCRFTHTRRDIPKQPIPVPRGLKRGCKTARLLGLWVRIPPGEWMSVSFECCVLSGGGRRICLITRPEEFYRVCCVW